MSIDQSAQHLLEGGAPAFKFHTVGTVAKGTVVSATSAQATDFQTREPKFYKDGNPIMQLVITLQTDERDPAITADDGQRRLFAGGKMLAAIRQAVARSGAKLDVGGTLAVQYTGDGEAERGQNPPKLYTAEYRPPVSTGGLLDGPNHTPERPW